MKDNSFGEIQAQLIERKRKLSDTLNTGKATAGLAQLLIQVDAALERINNGSYGICEVCHEPIESDRLLADPLATFCLSDLDKAQQKLLEDDLNLASKIQNKLLPENNIKHGGYEISYHYSPAGPVSGDYCDIVLSKNNIEEIFFILGDITGKGIAASMLVSHLHALFHSLIDLNLPLVKLMERANRLFCESALYSHFVTLICGKLNGGGEVEICNAGHCLPILIRKDGIVPLDSNGLPLGLFHQSEYTVSKFYLDREESIFIYSDGLSEARRDEEEFGVERINRIASLNYYSQPVEIINYFKSSLNEFIGNSTGQDDLTLMSIKRME